MQAFMDEHRKTWPKLEHYQQILQQNVPGLCSDSGSPLKFVPQGSKPVHAEDHYEARIYLKGEIQTRANNWHDFFQVLIWSIFPKTKSTLNDLHYSESQLTNKMPNTNRGPLENAIALFDECGSIIISCKEELLTLIREFQWKILFHEKKLLVEEHLRCFVFGHAMYEKAITPYIGMTSPAILLLVDSTFFTEPLSKQLQFVDNSVTELFNSRKVIQSPKDLHPFPLLGMPGWYEGQQNENFYDNTNYFRTGRRQNK